MNPFLMRPRSGWTGFLALLLFGWLIAAAGPATAAEALFSAAPGGSAAAARLNEKRALAGPQIARQRAVSFCRSSAATSS